MYLVTIKKYKLIKKYFVIIKKSFSVQKQHNISDNKHIA
jgi:hypothetical protein